MAEDDEAPTVIEHKPADTAAAGHEKPAA
jgi:hypothetical protein